MDKKKKKKKKKNRGKKPIEPFFAANPLPSKLFTERKLMSIIYTCMTHAVLSFFQCSEDGLSSGRLDAYSDVDGWEEKRREG